MSTSGNWGSSKGSTIAARPIERHETTPGPGDYNISRNKNWGSSKGYTMGKRYNEQVDVTPGPGQYMNQKKSILRKNGKNSNRTNHGKRKGSAKE